MRNAKCYSARSEESFFLHGTVTNHTRGGEIEGNLKIMNLSYFHHKRIGNVGNKNNSPVNIRSVAKTQKFL